MGAGLAGGIVDAKKDQAAKDYKYGVNNTCVVRERRRGQKQRSSTMPEGNTGKEKGGKDRRTMVSKVQQ